MRLRFPEAWAPPRRLAQIPRGKSSGGKRIAEHGQPAPRLLAGGLILDHVPVLRQQSVLDANNVEHDPFRGQAKATKPAMQHHHVALRHDQTVLIFTFGRNALNQAEEPVAPRWYMGAMLEVVGRPELLCCDEVLLIEQCLKRFEDKCLVSLGCKFAHFGSPWFCPLSRICFSNSSKCSVCIRPISRIVVLSPSAYFSIFKVIFDLSDD